MMRLCPPHWPARCAPRRDRPARRARPGGRLRGRLAARPADRRRPRAARDHGRLRAGARPRAARRCTAAIGDRALAADPALVGAARPGADRGLPRGRRAAGDQASAGPRPRPHRQPSGAAGGRAPRLELLRATDWQPFRDLPRGAVRDDRARPASRRSIPSGRRRSRRAMIGEVIRGELGIAGALLSDDLSMGALSGSLGERAAAARAAGCDLALHCNGRYDEMVEVLAAAGPLEGAAAARCRRGARPAAPAGAARPRRGARPAFEALLARVEPALAAGRLSHGHRHASAMRSRSGCCRS